MGHNHDRKSRALPEREIVSSRVFAAPRARVFDAFRDPEHLARWWGSKGFSNTFHEFDLRPGGLWHFEMHGPNGVSYENKSVFIDVFEPTRVVFEHVSGPRFQTTILFDGHGDTTTLTWRMLFESAADCDKVKGFAPEANEQNFDRLEAELERMA